MHAWSSIVVHTSNARDSEVWGRTIPRLRPASTTWRDPVSKFKIIKKGLGTLPGGNVPLGSIPSTAINQLINQSINSCLEASSVKEILNLVKSNNFDPLKTKLQLRHKAGICYIQTMFIVHRSSKNKTEPRVENQPKVLIREKRK